MASIWKIGGYDIYVDEDKEETKATIAELNPLDSTESTFHFIYRATPERTLEATVVGSGVKAGIESIVDDEVTLISDLVPAGITVLLTDASFVRQLTTCQLINTSLPSTAPVYRVTLRVRPQ